MIDGFWHGTVLSLTLWPGDAWCVLSGGKCCMARSCISEAVDKFVSDTHEGWQYRAAGRGGGRDIGLDYFVGGGLFMIKCPFFLISAPPTTSNVPGVGVEVGWGGWGGGGGSLRDFLRWIEALGGKYDHMGPTSLSGVVNPRPHPTLPPPHPTLPPPHPTPTPPYPHPTPPYPHPTPTPPYPHPTLTNSASGRLQFWSTWRSITLRRAVIEWNSTEMFRKYPKM